MSKNTCTFLAILVTMRVQWLPNGGGPCLHWKPLNATIRRVFTPYCPGGCHGHQFWLKNRFVPLWNHCSKASIQKAQNRPTTQLIEATSYIERSNATIKDKELSNFSSYQTLIMEKNWWSYQAAMKLVKSWRSWPSIADKLLSFLHDL